MRKVEELMQELKTRYTIYVDTVDGASTGYLVEHGNTKHLFDAPKEKPTQEYLQGEFS